MPNPFLQKVAQRKACIGIVGLGYVGLPLAIEFCRAGFEVVGMDIDRKKIDSLRASETYIRHIPSTTLEEINAAGRFSATDDFGASRTCDAVILCVPTPLTPHREPDMSYIVGTAEQLAPHLRKGQLYCLESTTYPGTTTEVLVPILEKISGLKAGVDFLVAYSPEREDPNNKEYSTGTIPKVVGGLDAPSLQAAQALYETVVCRTVPVSSTSTAEATKLLENIFRAVNIALVNELKVVFEKMEIDIWEVIDAAATKPFGYMPFYPGPGLGGHCIPIDPFYLTWKAREYDTPTRFIELAGEINSFMPYRVVQRMLEIMSRNGIPIRNARILLVGLSYKKNVDDPRESPSFKLWQLLEREGARVDYSDPYCPRAPHMRAYPQFEGIAGVSLDRAVEYDAVLIATAHDGLDYERLGREARLVVDTRNVVPDGPQVYKA